MTKAALIAGAVAVALVGAAAWAGLSVSQCRDVDLVCDLSLTDAGVTQSPSEVTVQVRGDSAPLATVQDPARGKCRVVRVGAPYTCVSLGAGVTFKEHDDASKPASGCACSSGAVGCEVYDPVGKKWTAAPKSPNRMDQSTWRGPCIPMPCSISEELVSGIGAVNSRDYASDPKCGGAGKVPPPLPSALKAAQAEVIK